MIHKTVARLVLLVLTVIVIVGTALQWLYVNVSPNAPLYVSLGVLLALLVSSAIWGSEGELL